jgi:hypothetical protein
MSLTDVQDFQTGKSPELGWQASLDSIWTCSREKREEKWVSEWVMSEPELCLVDQSRDLLISNRSRFDNSPNSLGIVPVKSALSAHEWMLRILTMHYKDTKRKRILPSVSLSRFERVAISLGMDPPRGLPTGGQELKCKTGSSGVVDRNCKSGWS